MVFRHFKYKLAFSVLVAVVSTLYQLDNKDEPLISEKVVLLSKNRKECFDFLSELTNYPTWFPNINAIESIDSTNNQQNKEVTVGKRYKMANTHLFGIGEASSQITVIGHQTPALFEFLVDNMLMERNRLSFDADSADSGKTRLTWKIYSRRKSLLFKYTLGAAYKFYYSQILREALFSLQFMLKK